MNLFNILLIALVIIAVISIFFYFFQERFIFHPEKLSKDFIFQYENQEVEEYNIQLNDNVIDAFDDGIYVKELDNHGQFVNDSSYEMGNIEFCRNVVNTSIDDAIDFILQKRTKSGHWLLEKTIRPGAMFARIEHKGIESKWVTYRALNVLKMYNEVN